MIRWNIWWIFGRPKSETIRGYLNKVSNPHARPATPDRQPKQGHNQEGRSIRAPGSIKPSKQPRKYFAPIGPIHGSNPNLKCSCRSILEKTNFFRASFICHTWNAHPSKCPYPKKPLPPPNFPDTLLEEEVSHPIEIPRLKICNNKIHDIKFLMASRLKWQTDSMSPP